LKVVKWNGAAAEIIGTEAIALSFSKDPMLNGADWEIKGFEAFTFTSWPASAGATCWCPTVAEPDHRQHPQPALAERTVARRQVEHDLRRGCFGARRIELDNQIVPYVQALHDLYSLPLTGGSLSPRLEMA
jgi:hypothetical protein